jgi:uncharacterized protein
MRARRTASFIALSYLIAWAFWFSAAAVGDQGFYVKWIGMLVSVSWGSVLLVLGGMAPGIAALVLGWHPKRISDGGAKKQLILTFRELSTWCFVGFSLPIFILGLAMVPYIVRGRAILTMPLVIHGLVFFLLNLFLSSFWEEYGWRGYLLPRLQSHYTPITASIVLGVVWGPWHLPKQLLLVPRSNLLMEIIFLFMIQIIVISILLSWLYNSSRARLLPAVLFHGSFNMMVHSLITPIADLYGIVPYVLSTGFCVIAAIIVVLSTGGGLGNLTPQGDGVALPTPNLP